MSTNYNRPVCEVCRVNPATECDDCSRAAVEYADDALARAQTRIAALEDALRAFDVSGYSINTGYIERSENTCACTYCSSWWHTGQNERHSPHCPVTVARALLGDA